MTTVHGSVGNKDTSGRDNDGSVDAYATVEGLHEQAKPSMSYASLLNKEHLKKKVNLHALTNEEVVDKADITIPMDYVEEVRHRFANTFFGYFLGKRLAFPIVENYMKNTWAKYGITKVMLNNGLFFFKFSSKTGMKQVLENGPRFIRTIPLILKTWTHNTTLKK